MKMYKKKCDYCGKNDVFVFGKDKTGKLPVAFCSKACEANAKYEQRFDNRFKDR